MAFNNFVPRVWAKQLEHDNQKAMVYRENCNTKYMGAVKDIGDSVRILGVAKPTITTTQDLDITLEKPEKPESTSVTMQLNTASTFNFQVPDIDEAQGVKGMMAAYMEEASLGLADEKDQFIAKMALDPAAILMNPSKADAIKVANILNYIDAAVVKLRTTGKLRRNEKITLTADPLFIAMLRQAYVKLDTDNSKMLENGLVGKYNNAFIKESVNSVVNEKEEHYIMLRTDRAVAFADPIAKTEAYRPEEKFSDAVKGLNVYGAKIVRPKEMIVLNCKLEGLLPIV